MDQSYPGKADNKRDIYFTQTNSCTLFNPLNPELNPICYLLALLAHHFLHVSRIMVKSLTHDLRRRAATGRSPAEIVGSNPTGGMDICLL